MTSPLACRFDEYTADITENRYLRAAVRRLLRVPGVRPETRQLPQRELSRFEGVSDVHVGPADADHMSFNRLNRHYEPAIRLAALVLRNLTLIDRPGAADASSFLVNMNTLFQDWVTDRLTRALRGRLVVEAEPTTYLGNGRRLRMAPDLVFRHDGEARYVGDVKYKLTDSGVGYHPDHYQLLAYTTAMSLPEGVLIYCRRESGAPEGEVVVRHAGKRLVTLALRLDGTPAAMDRSVTTLAERIWERSTSMAPASVVTPSGHTAVGSPPA